MDPKQILIRAREILTPQGAWTQRALARDKNGREATSHPVAQAVCFCTMGAVFRAGYELNPTGQSITYQQIEGAFDLLYKQLNYESLAAFNDNPDTTHDMVLNLFDGAIAS